MRQFFIANTHNVFFFPYQSKRLHKTNSVFILLLDTGTVYFCLTDE